MYNHLTILTNINDIITLSINHKKNTSLLLFINKSREFPIYIKSKENANTMYNKFINDLILKNYKIS